MIGRWWLWTLAVMASVVVILTGFATVCIYSAPVLYLGVFHIIVGVIFCKFAVDGLSEYYEDYYRHLEDVKKCSDEARRNRGE